MVVSLAIPETRIRSLKVGGGLSLILVEASAWYSERLCDEGREFGMKAWKVSLAFERDGCVITVGTPHAVQVLHDCRTCDTNVAAVYFGRGHDSSMKDDSVQAARDVGCVGSPTLGGIGGRPTEVIRGISSPLDPAEGGLLP